MGNEMPWTPALMGLVPYLLPLIVFGIIGIYAILINHEVKSKEFDCNRKGNRKDNIVSLVKK